MFLGLENRFEVKRCYYFFSSGFFSSGFFSSFFFRLKNLDMSNPPLYSFDGFLKNFFKWMEGIRFFYSHSRHMDRITTLYKIQNLKKCVGMLNLISHNGNWTKILFQSLLFRPFQGILSSSAFKIDPFKDIRTAKIPLLSWKILDENDPLSLLKIEGTLRIPYSGKGSSAPSLRGEGKRTRWTLNSMFRVKRILVPTAPTRFKCPTWK